MRSEIEPAGKVNKKNGSDALVAIADKRKGLAPREFISQVAAVSCAETQVPEMTLATQSPEKTGFFRASQTEVPCFRWALIKKEGKAQQNLIALRRGATGLGPLSFTSW